MGDDVIYPLATKWERLSFVELFARRPVFFIPHLRLCGFMFNLC